MSEIKKWVQCQDCSLLSMMGFIFAIIFFPQLSETAIFLLLYLVMLQQVKSIKILPVWVMWSSFIFLAAISISAVCSYNPFISARFLTFFTMYFIALILPILFINNRERLLWTCQVMAVSTILIGCYALWQYFSGNNISIIGIEDGGKRVIGGTAHPIIFSGYLFNLVVLFLFLGLKGMIGSSIEVKRFFLAIALFSIGIMLLTVTRGGWIALEGFLSLWFVFEWRRNRKQALFLASLVFIILLSFIVPLSPLNERATINDISVDWRIQMWGAAWRIFLDHPLTGAGLYQFHDLFYGSYFPDVSAKEGLDYGWQNAHSDYLNFLAESGILGFFGYLLFFGSLLWDRWRTYYKNPEDNWSLIALLLTFGYLLEGMTYSYFGLSVNMCIFFIIIGISYAAGRNNIKV